MICINDMHPNMIMHPYKPELNNTSLKEFQDHLRGEFRAVESRIAEMSREA